MILNNFVLHQSRIVQSPTRSSVCSSNYWKASGVDTKYGLDIIRQAVEIGVGRVFWALGFLTNLVESSQFNPKTFDQTLQFNQKILT